MIDIVIVIKQKQVYFALIYNGKVSLFFCRSPPVDLTWKVELMGGFLVKKIIIDGYEIIVDNGVFTRAIFKDTVTVLEFKSKQNFFIFEKNERNFNTKKLIENIKVRVELES